MMEHASTEATVKTKLTKAELKRMKKAGVFSAVLPVERSDFKKYSATLERKTRKPTEEKWCAIDLMGTAMVVGVKWISVKSKNPGYLAYGCTIHALETMLALIYIRFRPKQNDPMCQIYLDCIPDWMLATMGEHPTVGSENDKIALFHEHFSNPAYALSSVVRVGTSRTCFSVKSHTAMFDAKKQPSLYWEQRDYTLPG